jgi:hypothetical protein
MLIMSKRNQIIYVIIAIILGIYLIGKLGNAITKKASTVSESASRNRQPAIELLDGE